MKHSNQINTRLAVCSWSLQAQTPEILAERIEQTGVRRAQLALDPLYEDPAVWGKTIPILERQGIQVISGMVGCAGEDYTTLESIRLTGGIAPDHTWERNRKDITGKARLAAELGIKLVTFHAGFLPHDQSDPAFAKILARLQEVTTLFAAHKITVTLETGQETAADLARVLRALNQPNARVNFDPANMILYAKGDPIEAVRTLGPWISQTHIKDARATKVPGTWGEEVPLGTGDVNWPAFCAALDDIGFKGDMVIEREAGNDRVSDIRLARQVIERAFGKTQTSPSSAA
jgi:sugar phosphate isomerase/epimerase